MKQFAFSFSLIPILLGLFPTAVAGQEQQNGCQFDITGTWQSSTPGQMNSTRLRFGANGVMTKLSRGSSSQTSAWQATSKSTYKLDDPKAPKTMMVTPVDKSAVPTALQIKTFDNGLFV